MGKETGIEWCDHTFNCWWGCAPVSPGCAHCYAETLAGRFGTKWGKLAARRFFGDKHWHEPHAWNRSAERAGVRRKVFCASMADVFEDNDSLMGERARLADTIAATPHLDWLLLTKRPENAMRLAATAGMLTAFRDGRPSFLPNVWAGTTTEDQVRANERIPHLLTLPAVVRFLSVEPMLGPVNVTRAVCGPKPSTTACANCPHDEPAHGGSGCVGVLRDEDDDVTMCRCPHWHEPIDMTGIDWIICGGESGDKARQMSPVWARALRDECEGAGVPFFFKQWGEWAPQKLGDNPPRWGLALERVGKKAAGSALDGTTHKAFPVVAR